MIDRLEDLTYVYFALSRTLALWLILTHRSSFQKTIKDNKHIRKTSNS